MLPRLLVSAAGEEQLGLEPGAGPGGVSVRRLSSWRMWLLMCLGDESRKTGEPLWCPLPVVTAPH